MRRFFLHLATAFCYSKQGIFRLLQERAFKYEIYCYIFGMILIFLNAGKAKNYLSFTILILALFAIEAINTAIEEIVDHISPDISSVGKNAKDLGSAACFSIILANIIYLGGVLAYIWD